MPKPSARKASKMPLRMLARGSLAKGTSGPVHAEAVVVLAGMDDIAHAGRLGRLSPDGRIELDRIEGLGQGFIAALVFDVIGNRAAAPGHVLGADAPGLDDTPLAVGAPVHHQSELLVLEPLQLFKDQGIGLLVRGLFRLDGRGGFRPHCRERGRRLFPGSVTRRDGDGQDGRQAEGDDRALAHDSAFHHRMPAL